MKIKKKYDPMEKRKRGKKDEKMFAEIKSILAPVKDGDAIRIPIDLDEICLPKPVRVTDEICSFTKNPENANVIFDEYNERFIYNKNGVAKSLPGITSFMQKYIGVSTKKEKGIPIKKGKIYKDAAFGSLFITNYSTELFQKSEKKTSIICNRKWDEVVSSISVKIPLSGLSMNVAKGKKRIIRGLKLGTEVHEELDIFCQHFIEGELSKWAKTTKTINYHTYKIIMALKAMGLYPLASEFPIYDDYLGYATAIDLVCISKTGILTIIEIKTGYENNWLYSTKLLSPPFGHLGNCPKNLALIQIFLARMTLQKKYLLKDPVSMVIHVCNRGIDIHTIPPRLLIHEDIYYEKLCPKSTKIKPTEKKRKKAPAKKKKPVKKRHYPASKKKTQKHKRKSLFK